MLAVEEAAAPKASDFMFLWFCVLAPVWFCTNYYSGRGDRHKWRQKDWDWEDRTKTTPKNKRRKEERKIENSLKNTIVALENVLSTLPYHAACPHQMHTATLKLGKKRVLSSWSYLHNEEFLIDLLSKSDMFTLNTSVKCSDNKIVFPQYCSHYSIIKHLYCYV